MKDNVKIPTKEKVIEPTEEVKPVGTKGGAKPLSCPECGGGMKLEFEGALLSEYKCKKCDYKEMKSKE